MKKREMILHLIREYSNTIDWAKRSKCNRQRLMDRLNNRCLHAGLCYACSELFGDNAAVKWIKKYHPGKTYICMTPSLLFDYEHSKREMIEALRVRLGVLERELKLCK